VNVPILYLAYNRPEKCVNSFAAIRRVRPTKLFVAVDGPRDGRVGDDAAVEAVRRIVRTVDWPCQVEYLVRDRNRGLRAGVNEALDWFFHNVEFGIVLEDDIVASPKFFAFCKEMLERYQKDERVWMITGTNMLLHWRHRTAGHFFSEGSVWGWASWADRWKAHDQAMSGWESLEEKYRAAEILGPSWHRIRADLAMVAAGQLESWAYPWTFTRAAAGGHSVIPSCNLVENHGAGPKATHTIGESSQWRRIARCSLSTALPDSIQIDHEYARRVERRLQYDRYLRRFMPALDMWDETRALVGSK
jgi:hypothetical protein